MPLTKIEIRSKVDIENYYLCFFNVIVEEKLRQKSVLFLLQLFFFFFFLLNSKVFTVFLIARIPYSTVLIHFRQREKAVDWCCNNQLTSTSKIFILSAAWLPLSACILGDLI